jgi:hypothetical protein
LALVLMVKELALDIATPAVPGGLCHLTTLGTPASALLANKSKQDREVPDRYQAG